MSVARQASYKQAGERPEPFQAVYYRSHHQVSVKHLDRYLDEFEFIFNNRNNPYLFRDALMRLLETSNLAYKELTKKEAA